MTHCKWSETPGAKLHSYISNKSSKTKTSVSLQLVIETATTVCQPGCICEVLCHSRCTVKTYGWFLCAALLGLSLSHWVLKALKAKSVWIGGWHQNKFLFICKSFFPSDIWWCKSFSYFQCHNSGRNRKRSCRGVLWKVHVFWRHLEGCLFVLKKKKYHRHCLNHHLGPREQCSYTNLLC